MAPRLTSVLCLAVASAAEIQDVDSLVQAAVHAHQATSSGLLSGRAGMLAELAASTGQLPQIPGLDLSKLLQQPQPQMVQSQYNCSEHPWMCEEPFNCHLPMDTTRMAQKWYTMATQEGHANLRTWCTPNTAQYTTNLVQHCLRDKDLVKSGQVVYEETVRGKFGPFTPELDASYCFIEGHCSNTAVTNETTLEEAEQMCDFRYGHDAWAKNFGFKDLLASPELLIIGLNQKDPMKGFKHTKLTKVFLKAACAMGNYHCDVLYCRETYCKNTEYIKKYGYLLPKVPGHLIEQKEWLE